MQIICAHILYELPSQASWKALNYLTFFLIQLQSKSWHRGVIQSFLTPWEPAKKKVTTQRKLSRLSLTTVCRSQCLLHPFWRGCWISPRLSLELSRNEMTSSRTLGIQLFTLTDQMVENFWGRRSLNWTLEMNHHRAKATLHKRHRVWSYFRDTKQLKWR